MKSILIVTLFLFTWNIFAQSDTIDRLIQLHFEKHPPELYKTDNPSLYGNVKTDFTDEQIKDELALYTLVSSGEIINNPTSNTLALCHNILIHTPEKGKEFLIALNKPTDKKEIINFLWSEFIFTGEFGEQQAIKNLNSSHIEWQLTWAKYLNKYAVYDSSIPSIKNIISETNNIDIKINLISSLMFIGNPQSIPFVKLIIDTTQNDEIQEKALFVFTELSGYNGINILKSIKAVGPKSQKELETSIQWLEANTNKYNKTGSVIKNDLNFIYRFYCTSTPVMNWLKKGGYLNEKKASKPSAFTSTEKATFISLLISSKLFGFEAAKANLFLSLNNQDMEVLLQLRKLCVYTPNEFTNGRLNTLGIMIRYLKKQENKIGSYKY
ncbi:MAG: hypothetical protein MUE33_11430 [Cytophagaceae bacterium]|jgi:hypothetical protein|nr:hypothetical protein [Cytophagaceae bacterium]